MAKGWCSPHYYRLRAAPKCSVDGCGDPAQGKGFCGPHYARFRRHGDPTAGRIARGETKRWLQAHARYDGDDCLAWPYARSTAGYGVTWDGGFALAHRKMCEAVYGQPPTPNHEAAHSCGNGHLGCVNPRHLRWATKSENALDAFAHGTSGVINNRGETHRMAKLTDGDVLEIRRRRSAGERNGVLAREFGVNASCISNITSRKSWSHIE